MEEERSDKGKTRGKYTKHMNSAYRVLRNKCNASGKALLTEDEFLTMIKESCYYCGKASYTINRKSPLIDYTKGQCKPVCNNCNKLKGELNDSEFIYYGKAIHWNDITGKK